jgi:hypothetical protein
MVIIPMKKSKQCEKRVRVKRDDGIKKESQRYKVKEVRPAVLTNFYFSSFTVSCDL